MSYSAFSKFGSSKTPPFLKWLLITITSLSLGTSLLMILFKGAFPLNPYLLFGLSISGIKSGFIFQFITYPFFQLPSLHFDTGYLLHLFFNLYILWMTGTGLCSKAGLKGFITLVILNILLVGIFSVLIMNFYPSPYILLGTTPLIYTLLITWMMLNPSVKILLFFILPIQTTHLITGLLGLNLIMDLSGGEYTRFAIYLFSAVFAYLYALIIWNTKSPFHFLNKFETQILRLKNSLKKQKKDSHYSSSKIYDFKTGEPILDDDQFLDAMLTKINLYGKESLSSKEIKRMDDISKKK